MYIPRTTVMQWDRESVTRLMDGAKIYIGVIDKQPSDKGEFIGFYLYDDGDFILCDHKAGDIIGVREAWRREGDEYIYQADDSLGKFKPAFQLPVDGVRHWVEIKKLYAKRLQKLTMTEIRGCGYKSKDEMKDGWKRKMEHSARTYKKKGIPYTWEENPWVWVYEYKKVEKPKETRWD